MDEQFPLYKGRPLVRSGNVIYYGDMRDKYVTKIDIKSTVKKGDIDIADDVVIQLMYTNPTDVLKTIVKTSEKKGLFLALDIADVWLSRYLSE